MIYIEVKDPVWANSENTHINCQVLFEGQASFFPFTASASDTESYSVEIFNQCVAGQWGTVAPYVPVPVLEPTAEQNKATAIQLLANTDWAMTSDIADPAFSNPYLTNQAEFAAYRNTVRQVAINPVPGVLTWPTVPSAAWSSV